MGNGSGLKDTLTYFDFETMNLNGGVLTQDMIEEAAKKALADFGEPIVMRPHIYMTPVIHLNWDAHPQYAKTPWAKRDRLTKREHAVAKLHTTLKKFGVLKKISDEDFKDIQSKSIKRLKRARWAQYQQKRV